MLSIVNKNWTLERDTPVYCWCCRPGSQLANISRCLWILFLLYTCLFKKNDFQFVQQSRGESMITITSVVNRFEKANNIVCTSCVDERLYMQSMPMDLYSIRFLCIIYVHRKYFESTHTSLETSWKFSYLSASPPFSYSFANRCVLMTIEIAPVKAISLQ